MKRLSLHEWIPMLPWPVCPLAGHAKFGQNVVVGSMLVLRVALRNVPRGVCLDPHFHCKRTIPRLSVELPQCHKRGMLTEMVLWYFPEYKIAVISISYADMSMSQNVEKSVTQCARPLRFPWTSPM